MCEEKESNKSDINVYTVAKSLITSNNIGDIRDQDDFDNAQYLALQNVSIILELLDIIGEVKIKEFLINVKEELPKFHTALVSDDVSTEINN